jgi:hypothetical protein
MAEMEAKSLYVCIKDFFGMETRQCMEECKKLTDVDKSWFRVELKKLGYVIKD